MSLQPDYMFSSNLAVGRGRGGEYKRAVVLLLCRRGGEFATSALAAVGHQTFHFAEDAAAVFLAIEPQSRERSRLSG